ncbi:MAG: glycosyltransferase family 4 protein [Syntrophaceae bacterium]|nr:glycosyltransferase family 4 protein [Syntrophaceae bacterium]
MKILYFHQHFGIPSGSGGTRSYEFARRLVNKGHAVTMICGSVAHGNTGIKGPFTHGIRRGTVEGIHVIEFDLPYANRQSFLKRVWQFVKFAFKSSLIALRFEYDVVFATSTPLTAGIPGIIAKIFRRKPFVFEVRDLWPELPKAMGVVSNPVVLMLMGWLEWLSYHAASGCIGLSPGIVDGIKRRGIAADKIRMIPNGCDFDIFDNENIKKGRPDFISDTDLLATFTGAHGLANGLDAVLDAAAVLKKRNREDIKILFIGDGMLKPHLEKRAKEEKLDNCYFINPVPKRQLASLQKGADVGLMILANVPAFYYGTSPNKFFDYISSGLPVLNNYPGWLANLIKKNNCGIDVKPDDPAAFADALIYMAGHRQELKEMASNAKLLAYRDFGRDKLADDFIAFLELHVK